MPYAWIKFWRKRTTGYSYNKSGHFRNIMYAPVISVVVLLSYLLFKCLTGFYDLRKLLFIKCSVFLLRTR